MPDGGLDDIRTLAATEDGYFTYTFHATEEEAQGGYLVGTRCIDFIVTSTIPLGLDALKGIARDWASGRRLPNVSVTEEGPVPSYRKRLERKPLYRWAAS